MAVDPRTLKVGDVFATPKGRVCKVVEVDIENEIISTEEKGEDHIWEGFDVWWDGCVLVQNDLNESGHPRFLALLDQLRTMHLAKSADYGTASDVYANYRRTASLGIPPAKGILIRMADKWSRIETWANGGTLKNEGVIDSLLDLASYALGAVVMIEEEANESK